MTLSTWIVTLSSGALPEVTAEKVKTATDPILGDKVVQFWTGSTLVVQWPAFEVVTYKLCGEDISMSENETHTYRVALIDNKVVHLTADRVESGRGRMGFYEGKKLVRSFAEAEVVGYTRES